jgi:hypothetical protein
MPEPVTLFVVTAITAVLAIGAIAALTMWENILRWAQASLFPWLDQYLPEIAGDVRQAFVNIDNAVVALRREVQAQWRILRRSLLKQTVEIARNYLGRWSVVTTNWLIRKLDASEQTVVKQTTTEEVPYDELPSEVREEYILADQESKEINVTKTRDQELAIAVSG